MSYNSLPKPFDALEESLTLAGAPETLEQTVYDMQLLQEAQAQPTDDTLLYWLSRHQVKQAGFNVVHDWTRERVGKQYGQPTHEAKIASNGCVDLTPMLAHEAVNDLFIRVAEAKRAAVMEGLIGYIAQIIDVDTRNLLQVARK